MFSRNWPYYIPSSPWREDIPPFTLFAKNYLKKTKVTKKKMGMSMGKENLRM